MKLSRTIQLTNTLVISGISVLVWVLLLINPGGIMTIEHCHVSDAGASAKSLKMLLDMNPFSSQLLGWGLMVVAMMLPKLIMPIEHIYLHSLKRLRLASASLFVLGYMAVWMLAGVFMIAAILALHLYLPNSFLPAIVIGGIAVVWQFSPAKQIFLNRGHQHPLLAVFGKKALQDALLFGVTHGLWCVGAGWALMLFPMLLPQGHNAAMLVVTFIMISEHMEHPRMPQWYFSFRLKLLRILIAQTKIRLKWVGGVE